MRIVKRDDGMYAIKWGFWIFSSYLDLNDPQFWWHTQDFVNKYCWGSKERVLNLYKRVKGKHVTVSIKELE